MIDTLALIIGYGVILGACAFVAIVSGLRLYLGPANYESSEDFQDGNNILD